MLSETEILDRHKQALGEARRACQRLGRNADPTHLAPRGGDYGALKGALGALEGSCRQLAHWRADARWLRLATVYARAALQTRARFVGQRWSWFAGLTALFEQGLRRIEELDVKTGTLGPILPQRASEWLILPTPATAVGALMSRR